MDWRWQALGALRKMRKTLHATFDGKVLRPEEPVSLKQGTRVRITIDTEEKRQPGQLSFLQVAEKLNLDGPPDWSDRFEQYLYGDVESDG